VQCSSTILAIQLLKVWTWMSICKKKKKKPEIGGFTSSGLVEEAYKYY